MRADQLSGVEARPAVLVVGDPHRGAAWAAPVLGCLPTSTVVPGCSRSVPGQWPSASRLSRVLSHDVAAAHSRMNATSSAESLAA